MQTVFFDSSGSVIDHVLMIDFKVVSSGTLTKKGKYKRLK